jgi:hypothetical protein
MRSTCIPVAQSVVETPRHQASPSQVAQGAYRRILRSRIRVRRCRSSPRCRRMRRVYPAAVTCRVIQAGHERFAAREIGPVADLAGGKTRIPWDSFRRRAVRRGRGPARNRAVMARSSETGGVRDPLAAEPTKPGWVERKFAGWLPCSSTRLNADVVGPDEHPPDTNPTNIPKRIGHRGKIALHLLFPVPPSLPEFSKRNMHPPRAARRRTPIPSRHLFPK